MTVDPHLVALLGLPKLGPRRLARLLDAFGEPAAAWEAIRQGRLDGIPLHGKADDRPKLVERWQARARRVVVADLLAEHARCGITTLGPEDPAWPVAFALDPEPPALVFVRGDPHLLSAPSVAIVGTRRCTAAGASVARELGHDLALAGVGTASGLALGIDGAAHRGCLTGGGPAVGVVATGLDVVYPRAHADLWDQVAVTGVLLTEAPLGTSAERWRFPARNRLIAALALAVVVVESRQRGGSMLTVESAIDRDVPVLAVPGPVRSGASAGPNQLLFEGCGVVRDAADILAALGTAVPSPAGTTAELPFGVDDEPTEKGGGAGARAAVAAAVSWPASSLDQIVDATGLSFTEVAAQLARLELAGEVQRVDSGYQRRLER